LTAREHHYPERNPVCSRRCRIVPGRQLLQRAKQGSVKTIWETVTFPSDLNASAAMGKPPHQSAGGSALRIATSGNLLPLPHRAREFCRYANPSAHDSFHASVLVKVSVTRS